MPSPRYFQRATIFRPTFSDYDGDAIVPASGTTVDAAVWPRRSKSIVGGQGEIRDVIAIGFFPPSTDIKPRDRLTLAGAWAGTSYEVLRVISGFDDRGVYNHVGAELADVNDG